MTPEEFKNRREEQEKLHAASRLEVLNAKLFVLCGFITDSLGSLFAGNSAEAERLLKGALTGVVRFLHSDTPESRSLAENVLALLRTRENTSPEFRQFVQELTEDLSISQKGDDAIALECRQHMENVVESESQASSRPES